MGGSSSLCRSSGGVDGVGHGKNDLAARGDRVHTLLQLLRRETFGLMLDQPLVAEGNDDTATAAACENAQMHRR